MSQTIDIYYWIAKERKKEIGLEKNTIDIYYWIAKETKKEIGVERIIVHVPTIGPNKLSMQALVKW